MTSFRRRGSIEGQEEKRREEGCIAGMAEMGMAGRRERVIGFIPCRFTCPKEAGITVLYNAYMHVRDRVYLHLHLVYCTVLHTSHP